MPRRRPFSIPLTPAEAAVVKRLHEIQAEALDGVACGDYTLLEMMREDAREIIRLKKLNCMRGRQPKSEATKAKIGVAGRRRAASGAIRRDVASGRFSR